MELSWLDVGWMDYGDALVLQRKLHAACWQECGPDTILFQHSPPVITLGRGAQEQHLLWSRQQLDHAGIALHQVERGGEITYHGPGQLVISPILRFQRYARTAFAYLQMLEQTVIRLLESYGVASGRIEGKSGVWVGQQKIAAIGLSVSHGVTMHGLALNIYPRLEHFSAIVPCGLAGMGVTSLERQGCARSYAQVRDDWLHCFTEVFGKKPHASGGLDIFS